jgi:hypothetical protein
MFKAKITDNGIIRNWTNEAPLLYYRKTTNSGVSWTSFAAVNYTARNLDTFSFPIPGSAAGTVVQYYFAAQDIAMPIPRMATLPSGGSGVYPPGTTPPPTRLQFTVGITVIEPLSNEIPDRFTLFSNYPNPFNPVTKIRFDIPANSKSADGWQTTNVKLIVYDILGKQNAVLINGDLKAGRYEVLFDATSLSSGVYFYKLVSDNFVDTKKMLLVK